VQGTLYIFPSSDKRIISYDGVTQTNAGLLAPTNSELVLTSTGAGTITLTTGWKYNYAWYNSTKGITSDPYPLAGITTTSALGSITSILVSSFPATSSDSQVTGIRIYRTNDGGSTFYYNGQIDLGVTSYLDTVVDDSLGDEVSTRNNTMPACKYAVSAKRRIYAAGQDVYSEGTVTVSSGSMTVTGTSTVWQDGLRTRYFQVDDSSRLYQIDTVTTGTSVQLTQAYGEAQEIGASYSMYGEDNRVFFSEIDSSDTALPESCYLGLDYGDFVDLPIDGDKITGLGVARAYTILIFKNKKVVALAGTSKADFNLFTVNDNEGCVSHWTIANDHDGLCYFFSGSSVIRTDGSNFDDISKNKIDKYLYEYIDPTYNVLSHAQYYDKRRWYMLWVTTKGNTSPNICLIYDLTLGEWYQQEINAVCSAVVLNETTNENEIWIGSSSGIIEKLDQDDTFNRSVTSGTTRGTVTTATATTLVDTTTSSFFTSASGLKGCYVTLTGGTGVGQRRLISSSTGSQLTVSTDWVVTPIGTDTTYAIGAFDAYWYSRKIDLNSPDFKRFYEFLITFLNQKESTKLRVSFFVDLVDDSGVVAVTNGSPTVTGTDTLFTSEDEGKSILITGFAEEYIISKVTSQTSITLNKTYQGTTGTGLKYIMETFFTNIDCNVGYDALVDMSCRARYCQFRIGMRDSDRKFLIYNLAYWADGERIV